ncbi:ribosylnicotinamide kinase [Recurvomyces mirabilis]|uniref:Ribosylnicotinamide kinase n=1 Tax=Recurvomyces mirabilis TaxID=574656 RepID=A0AAE0WNX0_9PEZI|nr:ribosylnicotinamide kinase [Recurvomyces mirabilis]KAK5158364.1 ribosylnicotinamide kinase [Recurvomyces mirabilis]
MSASRPKALLISISGPSSSGKTTLSRLLRDIFPNTSILHEDDFYKPDAQIPMTKTSSGAEIADWDCLDALDLPALQKALEYIKANGMLPPDLVSKEDKNSVGKVDVDGKVVEDLHWRASGWMFQDVPPVVIIDGFLLYSESMKAIRGLFDVKIFLRTDFETARRRRGDRSGYVTLEGFWEDPPGYVEEVVWPNFAREHGFLFEGGDVEGEVDEAVVAGMQLDVIPDGARGDMTGSLTWAYEVVSQALEKWVED